MEIIPGKRQFVNFNFVKVDPAWKRLPQAERAAHKAEFLAAVSPFEGKFLMFTYSMVGIRPETDFMFWRISYQLEDFQAMSAALNKTALGKYFSFPYSYLSMTKRSIYIDKHLHPGQEGNRMHIVPARDPYIFIYPFVKTRAWYALSKEARQECMDEHIRVGHKYTSVRINTTYSFGLDDQEFVVAFETPNPEDFLDLVQELRESKASAYTERDVPVLTCVKKPLAEILDQLA